MLKYFCVPTYDSGFWILSLKNKTAKSMGYIVFQPPKSRRLNHHETPVFRQARLPLRYEYFWIY
jgi:hypothetical protein